jgi:hypothetical protein
MAAETQPCPHDKVYSNSILCSLPPQIRWICRLCLEEGVDVLPCSPVTDEYEQLRKSKDLRPQPTKDL